MSRQTMYAKIHIARKELSIDEDSYRAILMRITGKDSLTACNYYQLEAVINELKAKGFKTKSKALNSKHSGARSSKRASNPAMPDMRDKALALWIELERLGVVQDGSDQAFTAYCKKTSKVDHWHWMDEKQTYRVIEGLKVWLAREALRRLLKALGTQGVSYGEEEVLSISGASSKGVKSFGRMTAAMYNNAVRIIAQQHNIKDIAVFIANERY